MIPESDKERSHEKSGILVSVSEHYFEQKQLYSDECMVFGLGADFGMFVLYFGYLG